MCRGAMLGSRSSRSTGIPLRKMESVLLVGLPRSESGAAFASRARHAAAALLPPIASIYIGAGAALYAAIMSLERLRSAPPCGVEPSGSAIR